MERAGAHPKLLEKLAEQAPRARAERADRTFQSPPCNAKTRATEGQKAARGQEQDKRRRGDGRGQPVEEFQTTWNYS